VSYPTSVVPMAKTEPWGTYFHPFRNQSRSRAMTSVKTETTRESERLHIYLYTSTHHDHRFRFTKTDAWHEMRLFPQGSPLYRNNQTKSSPRSMHQAAETASQLASRARRVLRASWLPSGQREHIQDALALAIRRRKGRPLTIHITIVGLSIDIRAAGSRTRN
jgi:hypothetical protein